MGLDEIVVSGVGVDDLKKGPGHYSQTPLPGEHGNAAIAGHRTTYGAPFLDIDDLQPGDEVVATTYAGRFVYKVTGTTIVPPSEISVLDDTPDDRITLTSCDPKYSATNRIIVTATFDAADSSPIVGQRPPATDAGHHGADRHVTRRAGGQHRGGHRHRRPVATTAAPRPRTVAPSGGLSADEAFQRGWFDDAGAWPQVCSGAWPSPPSPPAGGGWAGGPAGGSVRWPPHSRSSCPSTSSTRTSTACCPPNI